MSVVEYYLYLAKFIKSTQSDLFLPNISTSQLFIKTLNEKPEIELKQDHIWHIGNIEYFDEMTGVFAVGRTTKTTVERFDPETGNFVDLIDDSGPYTHVLFDCTIGLLGIAKKTKVAPDVRSIARKITKLFENTNIIKEHGIEVRVDMIPDPDGFIKKLQSAYSIKRFKASFTGPNPVDADELFQKPLSVYCKEINGDYGNVEVVGEYLNEDNIEAVAKSTAATGNTASARIQPNQQKNIPILNLRAMR
ncbi:hypothetical protein AU255_04475 [Methyloprofundus sedimenti]|uniref:Uncharacterized protein n=1 Tax=Methyloprofundus sedimenti TaxID=1420851 RepID=A0A1V8M6G9_9GAMM|nr:hypothetical protein [Methyloprofundus sedimenti]OQK17161.1 hypothetical protein AU255_04475 [Methyloprofundus sedimenti]